MLLGDIGRNNTRGVWYLIRTCRPLEIVYRTSKWNIINIKYVVTVFCCTLRWFGELSCPLCTLRTVCYLSASATNRQCTTWLYPNFTMSLNRQNKKKLKDKTNTTKVYFIVYCKNEVWCQTYSTRKSEKKKFQSNFNLEKYLWDKRIYWNSQNTYKTRAEQTDANACRLISIICRVFFARRQWRRCQKCRQHRFRGDYKTSRFFIKKTEGL